MAVCSDLMEFFVVNFAACSAGYASSSAGSTSCTGNENLTETFQCVPNRSSRMSINASGFMDLFIGSMRCWKICVIHRVHDLRQYEYERCEPRAKQPQLLTSLLCHRDRWLWIKKHVVRERTARSPRHQPVAQVGSPCIHMLYAYVEVRCSQLTCNTAVCGAKVNNIRLRCRIIQRWRRELMHGYEQRQRSL